MILNRFRAFGDKLIRGPVDFFVRHNITPNKLTLIGFGITVFVTLLFWGRVMSVPYLHWMMPTFILIGGAFDAFDGSVARKMNLVTNYGGFLDSTLDRYSDALLFFGMAAGGYFDMTNSSTPGLGVYLGFWAVISCLLISYIRSAAEKGGVNMKGVGFMERGERILIILVGSFIYGGIGVGYQWTPVGLSVANDFFFWFLIVFCLLMDLTIVERVVFAIQNLRRIDQGLPPMSKSERKAKKPLPSPNA